MRMQGVLLLFVVALSVPAHGQRNKKQELPQRRMEKASVDVPSLAALAETQQSQLKSGLRITLQPETFQAKESVTVSNRQVRPPSLGPFIANRPGQMYVERTEVPKLTVSPGRLIFRLQLNNQMARVFRGSGIAVQFNVAGKTVPVDSSGYGELINIVLPPRSEQGITILGPEIATIPARCTVGVFFFDVVTNMDQAGNVTEKQNFEWYFSYQTQTVEKEISVLPPERLWIDLPGGR